MTDTADVIVVGVGTCGEDVSLRLLNAGLNVIGVEERLVGGECAYWACIPSKWMIRSANLVQEVRRADGLVGEAVITPDWPNLAARLRAEVTGGWDDSFAVGRFEGKGGRFVRGRGKLTGPRTVEVDGETYTARRGIVLATGSSPVIPPIPGLTETGFWSTHDAIAAEQVPDSLIVLGGGAVGCELGQVFARFGSVVTIVEAGPRLLPAEEPEVSEVLAAAFAAEGIVVQAGRPVTSVEAGGEGVIAHLEDGSELTAEHLLVATGRKVELAGLGLEAAGIDGSGPFIEVDDRLRAADGIWAIGDVTGKGLFTHVAVYQASIAVGDILGNDPPPADYRTLPRAVFTDPEVGSVGLTEADARAGGLDVAVAVKQVPATFRGWLHRIGNAGVIKLIVDRDAGVLVGAAAAGPSGAEVLGMLSVAIRSRVPVEDLVNMIYAFPTFYGGVGEALGAFGRGITRVLDPDTPPMFDD